MPGATRRAQLQDRNDAFLALLRGDGDVHLALLDVVDGPGLVLLEDGLTALVLLREPSASGGHQRPRRSSFPTNPQCLNDRGNEADGCPMGRAAAMAALCNRGQTLPLAASMSLDAYGNLHPAS
jgi:hypothetical protein